MRSSSVFEVGDSALLDFIAAYPLGLMISRIDGDWHATPLPLLVEALPTGQWGLLGHLALSNPHVRALESEPVALILFLGPHGYISPSWLRDRSQAPTWNFAFAQMTVEVSLERGPDAAKDAVERLSSAMESGHPRSWKTSELGDRYSKLLRAIVAFRARIIDVQTKFKLGQNERIDVLSDIVANLQTPGDLALRKAIVAANIERLACANGYEHPLP